MFTVNWDDLVEKACSEHGVQIHVVMPTDTKPCACALGHLYKLHGHPHLDLSAATSSAPEAMGETLRSALAERDVAVYGYSAQDLDLRNYLMEGLKKARSFAWFCLPADANTLAQLLRRLVETEPTVHAAEDPAPLLAAWGSAHGLSLEVTEPTGRNDDTAAAAALTPRVLALVDLLRARPTDLQRLDDRAFEELVAALLERDGFGVKLTRATKDGGVDVIATKVDPVLGNLRYLAQCKRYGPDRRVGIDPVRALYGLVSAQRATGGLVITTGFVTRGAREFQRELSSRLTVHDYEALQQWIKRTAGGL